MELRTAASPRDVKHYTTERLREEFLIEKVFFEDDGCEFVFVGNAEVAPLLQRGIEVFGGPSFDNVSAKSTEDDIVLAEGIQVILEIVGDVAVTPSADSKDVRFFGDITGSGTLTIGGNRTTCELAGDNSGFSGSIVAEKDSVDRKNIYLSSETAASENARWTVYSSGGGNEGFLHFKNKTVKFGSMNGNLYFNQMNYAGNVLEVGALGDDMEISGKFCYADGNNRISGSGNDIRKVGAGNLTLMAQSSWAGMSILPTFRRS